MDHRLLVPTSGSSVMPQAPSKEQILEKASPSTIETPRRWYRDRQAQQYIARQQYALSPTTFLPSTIRCRLCEMYIGLTYEEQSVYFWPVWDMHVVLGNQIYYVEHTILLLCGHCAARVPMEDEKRYRQRLKQNPDAKMPRKALSPAYQFIHPSDWSGPLASLSQIDIQARLRFYLNMMKCFFFMPRFLAIALALLPSQEKIVQAPPRRKKEIHRSLPFMGMAPVASISMPHLPEGEQELSLLDFIRQEEQRFLQ